MAQINFGNKVNVMILEYALKLSLKIYSTNVKTKKIDSSIFKMFEMILANFKIKNKLEIT